MTKAQEEAMEQIERIMSEHFEGGVWVVMADKEEDVNKEAVQAGWHGGMALALGLMCLGEEQVRAAARAGSE